MVSIITTLRLTSKFNSSVPGRWYIDPSAERRRPTPNKEGANSFPISRTASIPVFVPDKTNPAVSKDVEVAIIPASGLRGHLRTIAANRIFAALRRRGEKISFRLTHVIQSGAATAKPAKEVVGFDEASPSCRHPFVGLLGGGPVMIPSTLTQSDGIPVCESTRDAGLLPRELSPDIPIAQDQFPASLVGYEFSSRIDQMLRATGDAPLDLVEQGGEELAKWLVTLGEGRLKRDAKDKAKSAPKEEAKEESEEPTASIDTGKIGIGGISYREFVIPGLHFVAKQSIDNEISGDASVGLFILNLVDFANEQRHGGCGRVGYGTFDLTASLTLADGTVINPIKNINGKYSVDDSSEFISKALAEWKAVEDSITGKELNDLFFADAS
jgi:CRISPR type IV-associated protein Csf2